MRCSRRQWPPCRVLCGRLVSAIVAAELCRWAAGMKAAGWRKETISAMEKDNQPQQSSGDPNQTKQVSKVAPRGSIQARQNERKTVILVLFILGGIFVVMGLFGISIGSVLGRTFLPAYDLGFLFIAIGVLGVCKINIWHGPFRHLHPRLDPPEPSDAAVPLSERPQTPGVWPPPPSPPAV